MFGSRERIWIIEDDGNSCGEVLGSAKMLGSKCRGSGTGTTLIGIGTLKQEINSGQSVPVPLQPVPVPPYIKEPVENQYRYHSNRYRYQHGIVTGIEQDYDSNARVHSSFDHQLEITMEKGIKSKGKMEKVDFDFEGFGFHKKSVLSHSFFLGL